MIKAVIMAGGKGTRLKPLTDTQPKPLVPVGGEPVLIRILRLLRQSGVEEAVIAAGCFREQIESVCGPLCEGVRLHYTEEKTPLGTAGSVKAAEAFLCGGDFFVLSGDALCEFDLKRALRFHREQDADVTMLLTGVEDPTEYGMVLAAPDGRVLRFVEKPDLSQAFTDTVNTGIYLLSPRVLREIPNHPPVDFGHDLFPRLVREGKRVFGLRDNGYWSDIGSPEAYLAANLRYAAQSPTDLPANCINSVIGRNCKIGLGTEIVDSVLMDDVTIGAGTHVCGAVLCRGVKAGQNCRIEARTVLGEGVLIEDGAAVSGVRLEANCRVPAGSTLQEPIYCGLALSDRLFSGGVFYGDAALLTPALCGRIGEAAAVAFGADGVTVPEIGVMYAGNSFTPEKDPVKEAARGILRGGGSCVMLGAGFLRAAARAAAELSLDGVIFVRADRGNTEVTVLDRNGLRPCRGTERRLLACLRQSEHFARSGEQRDASACADRLSDRRKTCAYLTEYYGPALRQTAGDLTGVRIAVTAHRNTAAASATGVLTGVLTEAGADMAEDAPLKIDMDEDGCRMLLTEGQAEADFSHILALLLIGQPDRFREPLTFSCTESEELVRLASRLGYACIRYASCPADGTDDEARRQAGKEPLLRDALFAAVTFLSFIKESGETLSGLLELLPPFVRRTGRIPARAIRASVVGRLGKPDGDGVYRAASGGGVRVVPERGGYRLIAEAYSAEYADELLSETEQRLRELLKQE